MDSPLVITAAKLSKAYRIWQSPSRRLTSSVVEQVAPRTPRPGGNWPRHQCQQGYQDFHALQNVSFEVRRGEAVGVVGRKGAGKSTLLQLIAGTLQPTAGSIQVRGRVTALLEPGIGFNIDFTGRENVFLGGGVVGLSQQDMSARFDEIAAFADIGEFIDQPVKTYSSSMLMRLAFAVNTCVAPDILIVDEALSVSDAPFQAKCLRRLRQLIDQGVSLVFVSHDINTVRSICSRALWLNQGQAEQWGDANQVTRAYEKFCWAEQDVVMDQAPTAPPPVPAAPATDAPIAVTSQEMAPAQLCGDSTVEQSAGDPPAALLARRPAFKHLWHIESPLPARLANGFLELRGWCIGPGDEPARLRLRINDMVWAFTANQPRPDVRAVHPRMSSDACGFIVRMRVPAGRHKLVLEAVDATDLPVQLVNHPFTVPRIVALNRWLRTNNASLLAFQLMVGPSFAPRPIARERFPRPVLPPELWPRFSIITPSFQQGRFLERTILSVLRQPVRCDYVVQDGGSTDESVAVIRRHADRLAAWESAPDRGQSDAIARGFAKTSGQPDDLMAWINSDDFYLPGTLAFVADYFARHPEVDVLYGNRILVDEESRAIGRWFLPRHDDAVLRLNDFVPQETLFWRRRIWDKAGPVDPTYSFAMDWDLLLRFQAAGARIVHLPYFLACFRVHASQKTLSTIQSVGQREIDQLRARANGRVVTQAELESDPRLIAYLRRSALAEIAWSLELRME